MCTGCAAGPPPESAGPGRERVNRTGPGAAGRRAPLAAALALTSGLPPHAQPQPRTAPAAASLAGSLPSLRRVAPACAGSPPGVTAPAAAAAADSPPAARARRGGARSARARAQSPRRAPVAPARRFLVPPARRALPTPARLPACLPVYPQPAEDAPGPCARARGGVAEKEGARGSGRCHVMGGPTCRPLGPGEAARGPPSLPLPFQSTCCLVWVARPSLARRRPRGPAMLIGPFRRLAPPTSGEAQALTCPRPSLPRPHPPGVRSPPGRLSIIISAWLAPGSDHPGPPAKASSKPSLAGLCSGGCRPGV